MGLSADVNNESSPNTSSSAAKLASDSATSVHDLRELVREFVDQRDWLQFHSPKNLSMALAIEAGELMEHFQWISMAESRERTPEQLTEIGEELADVLCYAFAIANEMNIDVASTMSRKMELNRQKYPVKQFKGRFGADDPNSVQI